MCIHLHLHHSCALRTQSFGLDKLRVFKGKNFFSRIINLLYRGEALGFKTYLRGGSHRKII